MSDVLVRVHPGVRFGGDHRLEEFVIVGKPPDGCEAGDLETWIGPDALIRSHSVVYAGTAIGRGFRCGHHVTIRERTEIGDGVSIGTGSVVEHRVRIANGVRLHSNVFLPEFSLLEEGCWLGPNVVVTNARYPCSPNVKNELRGATIRRGAIVGANVTLLPGIELGAGCIIGAGSVVVKDVPAGVVVAGNPARAINTRDRLPYAAATLPLSLPN